MMNPRLEFAEATDRGLHRVNNEDRCLVLSELGVFCVADGMGGAADGELASEAIMVQLRETVRRSPRLTNRTLDDRVRAVQEAIQRANRWIRQYADDKLLGQMGSTVVTLVVDPATPARAVILHAGDSRVYRYRQECLELLTRDHTTGEIIAAKSGQPLAEIPARLRNELTRAVGVHDSVELSETATDLAPGDRFLLCTDGLTRMVDDHGIEHVLRRGERRPIRELAKQLIDAANRAGGRDNITVVLVGIPDTDKAIEARDADESEGSEKPTTHLGAPAQDGAEDARGETSSPRRPDSAGGCEPRSRGRGSEPLSPHGSAPTDVGGYVAIGSPRRRKGFLSLSRSSSRFRSFLPAGMPKRVFHPRIAIGLVGLLVSAIGVVGWHGNWGPAVTSENGQALEGERVLAGTAGPAATVFETSAEPRHGDLPGTEAHAATTPGNPARAGGPDVASVSREVQVRFERMLVWFGCVLPSDRVLLTAEARHEQAFALPIEPGLRDRCLDDLMRFDTKFPPEVLLRRHYSNSNLVNALRRAIHEWPLERRP